MMNIESLPAEYMLAALYKLSRPQGMGFLAAMNAPEVITSHEAARLLQQAGFPEKEARFDYLGGRPIKVTFLRDGPNTIVDRTDLYDRDVGPGAARLAFEDALATYTTPR